MPWGGKRFAKALDVDDLTVVPMRGWRRAMSFERHGAALGDAVAEHADAGHRVRLSRGCAWSRAPTSRRGGARRGRSRSSARRSSTATRWAERLRRGLPGVRFRPLSFRPMFHKFAGARAAACSCTSPIAATFRPYRAGIALLVAARELAPRDFRWRTEPYEFVSRPPAIDLLTGSDAVRAAIDAGAARRDLRRDSPRSSASFPSGARPLPDYVRVGDARRAVRRELQPSPHVAHQMAALYVLETAPVDELWFVPCFKHAFEQAARAVREPLAHVRARRQGPRRARARHGDRAHDRRPEPHAQHGSAPAGAHPSTSSRW